jgi:hypothetical protein
MKKTPISLLLLAGLLLVSSLVSAQAPVAPDLLYLKDGSVIRGTLIESIAGSHVRFQIQEGEVRQYPIAEVASTKVSNRPHLLPHEMNFIGFSHFSNIGVMIGRDGYYNDKGNLSLQTINGARFGKHFSAGIGTGLEGFGFGTQVPLFAHVRHSLSNGAIRPYVDGMAGYSFILTPRRNDWEDIDYQGTQGGFTAGVGAGIKMMTNHRFGLTLGMGYRFQQITRDYLDPWWNNGGISFEPVLEQKEFHRFELRFGIFLN